MSDKEKILIADDSAMNRAILTEMLGDGYELLEAENGRQAVAILQSATDIDLLLLDIMMPEMDGFEVLAMMNKYHWIDEVPVIMISAENASSYVERAYDLGATDYISRPFDMAVVRRRVINTLMLYAKQKRLVRLVAEQVYEKEKSNSTMINILSHIVEFRNGESGMHVLHIQTATDILLHTLVQKTDKYHLTAADISLISTASALHDIGKINIPESILNKPGRLTKEEFEVMKTHTTIGSEILEKLPFQQESDLVKTAYAICRWHHERWDGRGYPDGLKGEQIPIAAQVVSMADVYDALTSERCYKKAFDHDTAVKMILNGECGQFNPLLLECLTECGAQLHAELSIASDTGNQLHRLADAQHISDALLRENALPGQNHIVQSLSRMQQKGRFFNQSVRCIQFAMTSPPVIFPSRRGRRSTWACPKICTCPMKSRKPGSPLRILRASRRRCAPPARNTPTPSFRCCCPLTASFAGITCACALCGAMTAYPRISALPGRPTLQSSFLTTIMTSTMMS